MEKRFEFIILGKEHSCDFCGDIHNCEVNRYIFSDTRWVDACDDCIDFMKVLKIRSDAARAQSQMDTVEDIEAERAWEDREQEGRL